VRAGIFDREIVPVSVPRRGRDPLVLTADEGVRPQATLETLAPLKPAFAAQGSITAGNFSALSDGAAAMVLTTRGFARENGPLVWLRESPGLPYQPDSLETAS